MVSVARSGDGKRVVSRSFDKSVRVWGVETGAQVGEAQVAHTSYVQTVAMSGDGREYNFIVKVIPGFSFNYMGASEAHESVSEDG